MEAVRRVTVAHHWAPGGRFDHVEVRRITIAPSVALGAHVHNGAVFGVIETGAADVQVADGPVRRLGPGEVFFEPADEVITRFDPTEEGVTFLAWFPVPGGVAPELAFVEPPP